MANGLGRRCRLHDRTCAGL